MAILVSLLSSTRPILLCSNLWKLTYNTTTASNHSPVDPHSRSARSGGYHSAEDGTSEFESNRSLPPPQPAHYPDLNVYGLNQRSRHDHDYYPQVQRYGPSEPSRHPSLRGQEGFFPPSEPYLQQDRQLQQQSQQACELQLFSLLQARNFAPSPSRKLTPKQIRCL